MESRYLFRGKRFGGGWIVGSLVDSETISKNSDRTDLYAVNPDTIGQCTGFKDKNGSLIFEDDIVLIPKLGAFKIIWGIFSYWALQSNAGKECFSLYTYASKSDCEVIGNIYDSPDLITE